MSGDDRRDDGGTPLFVFPEWQNKVPGVVLACGGLAAIAVIAAVWYWFSPSYTDVGYMPEQPVPYSHKLHAGDLGIDCRYCHVGVERGPVAGVPPTQTCMNCHTQIKTDSLKLLPVRESWATGNPVPWVRIHKIPDFARFDHSAHVGAGVGCEECHGRIDQMPEVSQQKPLSMGWCLDCHRDPSSHLRPPELVTKMGYEPQGDRVAAGKEMMAKKGISPPTHCSGCHQ
jgi:hypothetical protein